MVGEESALKNGVMLVAHPDDCIIFGHHYLSNVSMNWKIIYLTYDADSPRGKEVATYWNNNFHIETIFLGFNDNPDDLKKKLCSISEGEVIERLSPYINGCDLLLTHGKNGEYGHPHHIFLNKISQFFDVEKVYFAHLDKKYSIEYSSETPIFNLNEFPKHKDIAIHFNNRANILYRGKYLSSNAIDNENEDSLVLLNKFFDGKIRIFVTNSHWQTPLKNWLYLLEDSDYLFVFDHNNVTHFSIDHWRSQCLTKNLHNIIFFSSTVIAHENRLRAGLNSHLISNNIIVNESKFKIDDEAEKIFDSLYVSRDIKEKNIGLASEIPRLALVIDRWYQSKYFQPAGQWKSLNYSCINFKHLGSKDVSYFYNCTKTSLSLMELEGASMGAMESILCGIPVIYPKLPAYPKNTLGGREMFLHSGNSTPTELNKEGVSKAVRNLISRNLEAKLIRNDAISFLHAQRRYVAQILDEIFKKNKINEFDGNEIMFENCWDDSKNGRHRIAAEGYIYKLAEVKMILASKH